MKSMTYKNPENKKLRLMQITHDLAIGGLQQVIVNICKTIDREKFDISVLCLRESGEFVPEVEKMGIKIIFLPQDGNGIDYFSFLKVAKILRHEKIEVIHTHNTQPFVDGTIGALLAGVRTIVHTDHARNFPDKKRYMFAEWAVSHWAHKIVGVSDHTSDNLIKYEHISSKKVITIPNGIDGSRYHIKIDKRTKRQELGINENGFVIGLGVRLAEQKGITYLLNAMPEIIKQFPNISLIIAGQGELENQLRQEIVKLGIEKNVFLVGPRLDMPELLQLFDLYVLPSLWEGLPMVLLEAMAAACPIVATDVGGNSTVIEHRINGSLIEPSSSSAISDEVIKVLLDETLLLQYIKKSLEIFRAQYSARIMTNRYEKLYLREK